MARASPSHRFDEEGHLAKFEFHRRHDQQPWLRIVTSAAEFVFVGAWTIVALAVVAAAAIWMIFGDAPPGP